MYVAAKIALRVGGAARTIRVLIRVAALLALRNWYEALLGLPPREDRRTLLARLRIVLELLGSNRHMGIAAITDRLSACLVC